MTTNKRIVEYHISRLQHRDRLVRLEAIAELSLLADPDALDPLRNIFENDSDYDVRQAAQQAGRTIFLKQHHDEDEQSG